MSRHATVDGSRAAAAMITGVGVIDVWRVPPSLIRVRSSGKGFPDNRHPIGGVDASGKAFSYPPN
jgi:hypothetical protein